MTVNLEGLIAPTSSASFFAEHWDQAPLRSGPVPGVASLLTSAEIEFLVASLGTVDADWIKVVREGRPLPVAALRTADAAASLAAVFDAFRRGYTLQLAKLDRRHEALARLCRRIEGDFVRAGVPLGRHAGSHLYLTPAGSRGLAPHYDNHSVLVLQVDGAKRWRLWTPVVEYPVGRQMDDLDPDALGPPAMDVRLAEGDVLYVPRGWVHVADSTALPSTHVTVDLYPATWSDLLGDVLQTHPELRAALPAGTWSTGQAAAAGAAARRLVEAVGDEAVDAAITAMVKRFVVSLAPLAGDVRSQLDALDTATDASEIQVRQEAVPTYRVGTDEALLCFAGSSLSGTGEAAELLRFLATTDRCAIKDLPGDLTAAGRRELVAELLTRGLVELVPDA